MAEDFSRYGLGSNAPGAAYGDVPTPTPAPTPKPADPFANLGAQGAPAPLIPNANANIPFANLGAQGAPLPKQPTLAPGQSLPNPMGYDQSWVGSFGPQQTGGTIGSLGAQQTGGTIGSLGPQQTGGTIGGLGGMYPQSPPANPIGYDQSWIDFYNQQTPTTQQAMRDRWWGQTPDQIRADWAQNIQPQYGSATPQQIFAGAPTLAQSTAAHDAQRSMYPQAPPAQQAGAPQASASQAPAQAAPAGQQPNGSLGLVSGLNAAGTGPSGTNLGFTSAEGNNWGSLGMGGAGSPLGIGDYSTLYTMRDPISGQNVEVGEFAPQWMRQPPQNWTNQQRQWYGLPPNPNPPVAQAVQQHAAPGQSGGSPFDVARAQQTAPQAPQQPMAQPQGWLGLLSQLFGPMMNSGFLSQLYGGSQFGGFGGGLPQIATPTFTGIPSAYTGGQAAMPQMPQGIAYNDLGAWQPYGSQTALNGGGVGLGLLNAISSLLGGGGGNSLSGA